MRAWRGQKSGERLPVTQPPAARETFSEADVGETVSAATPVTSVFPSRHHSQLRFISRAGREGLCPVGLHSRDRFVQGQSWGSEVTCQAVPSLLQVTWRL